MYFENDDASILTRELWRNVLIAALLGLVLVVAGCDARTPDSSTVGQKVDKAIDKTAAAADRAGATLEEAAKSAGGAIERKAAQAGKVLADSAITASVKTNLIKDPGLSALKIDVDTVKGVVTLTGETETAEARVRAERIASVVDGVVSVQNQLRIKPKG